MFWPLALPLAIVLAAGVFRHEQPQPDQLQQIRERGSLVMLTRNGASSYFQGPDGETGPEYDLAQAFAAHLGVALEVRVADEFSQLEGLLNGVEGDFIAANLSRTPAREQKFRFGPGYAESHIDVVYRRGARKPKQLSDLAGKRIAVIAGSSYEELLQELAIDIPGLDWSAHADAAMEDLLQAIDDGELDATLVDTSIFTANHAFYPNVKTAFSLDDAPRQQAWAFRKNDDDSLAQAAEVFMLQARNDGRLAMIQEQYHGDHSRIDQLGMHRFMERVRERLPQYLPVFREVADTYGIDWRLLAALGYQESQWDANAASHTGVRGLMMLTQRTANQLGLRDRTDPAQSIEGGARYLARMHKRTPSRIAEPDRTWMALAAYNIGWGHLEDARVLTQRQGGNPDSWADVRARLPLLTQEKYYREAKHGFARGYETQRHVRDIRSYYEILVWMDTREHPLLVAAL
jgi:membrane-bound lytic murein transglycosylase F